MKKLFIILLLVSASVPALADDSTKPKGVSAGDAQNAHGQSMTNPLAVLQMAKETSVKADLKQLHSAATVYYMEHGGAGGDMITVQKLKEMGYLPPGFKIDKKGPYRYTVSVTGKGAKASAVPVLDGSGAKRFFINEDGDLSANKETPAMDKISA